MCFTDSAIFSSFFSYSFRSSPSVNKGFLRNPLSVCWEWRTFPFAVYHFRTAQFFFGEKKTLILAKMAVILFPPSRTCFLEMASWKQAGISFRLAFFWFEAYVLCPFCPLIKSGLIFLARADFAYACFRGCKRGVRRGISSHLFFEGTSFGFFLSY